MNDFNYTFNVKANNNMSLDLNQDPYHIENGEQFVSDLVNVINNIIEDNRGYDKMCSPVGNFFIKISCESNGLDLFFNINMYLTTGDSSFRSDSSDAAVWLYKMHKYPDFINSTNSYIRGIIERVNKQNIKYPQTKGLTYSKYRFITQDNDVIPVTTLKGLPNDQIGSLKFDSFEFTDLLV